MKRARGRVWLTRELAMLDRVNDEVGEQHATVNG